MDHKIRPLRHIKDDIKLITTNRLSSSQSKLLFMGIIYEIILRRDLFANKSDLKLFINEIFGEYLYRDENLKDYLYLSRGRLASKIQKDILFNLEYNQIIEIVEHIYDVFPDEELKKYKNSRSINTNIELASWMNFIREKDKK